MAQMHTSKNFVLLICLVTCLILSACSFSVPLKTKPEYRTKTFIVQDIQKDYIYVIPQDSEDLYIIDSSFLKGKNISVGRKIEVQYLSLDKGSLYGLGGVHSISVLSD